MSRNRRSYWSKALEPKRSRKKRTLADGLDLLGGKRKRRSGLGFGLERSFDGAGAALGLGKRGRGMAGGLDRIISRRLTPTDRWRIDDTIEDEISRDDNLSDRVRDATLTGDEGFIRRLVRVIRERTGIHLK